jgi:hypothetical protein
MLKDQEGAILKELYPLAEEPWKWNESAEHKADHANAHIRAQNGKRKFDYLAHVVLNLYTSGRMLVMAM